MSERSIAAARPVPTGIPPRTRARRAYVAVIACIGVIAGGSYVATLSHEAVPRGEPARDRAPGATRPTLTAPAGMVRLPAQDLELGSSDDEIAGALAWCQTLTTPGECRRALYERESPVHRVRLSPLWLDVHERSTGELAAWLSGLPGLRAERGWLVTGGVRLAEVGNDCDLRLRGTAIVARPGAAQLPAVEVTYDGARRFCQARGMDLPTEAQWERAARGPGRRRFPWGDLEPTCGRATYGRGEQGPCPPSERVRTDADTGDRTPEGIANLGGNVAEWVVDRYVDGGYAACAAPCTDPVVEPTSDPHELHVIRGGGFESLAEQLRGAGRGRAPRDAAFGNTGFRCARPAPERNP